MNTHFAHILLIEDWQPIPPDFPAGGYIYTIECRHKGWTRIKHTWYHWRHNRRTRWNTCC